MSASSASIVAACGGNTSATSDLPPSDAGTHSTGGSAGAVAGGTGGTGWGAGSGHGGTSGASGSSGTGSRTDAGPECVAPLKKRHDDLANVLPGSPYELCNLERPDVDGFGGWDYACFAGPRDGATCASTYERQCVEGAYSCGLIQRGELLCGPLAPVPAIGLDANACCYVLVGHCAVGRPFIVRGQARIARSARGEGWRTQLSPDTTALDRLTREALADAYRQEGLTEHASVASFARFVLQCLALGAPAEIVMEAQRAGIEEIEHARLSFGLASAYSGHPERPLELDIAGALDGEIDARAVALSVAREGCIAETISALLIAAARDAAEDPIVSRVLSEVAEQEIGHALLAWRYLNWALQGGDRELHRAVAAVFARADLAVGLGAVTSVAGCPRALRAHGYLPLDERRSIANEVLRHVVEPAARALLESAAASVEPDQQEPEEPSVA